MKVWKHLIRDQKWVKFDKADYVYWWMKPSKTCICIDNVCIIKLDVDKFQNHYYRIMSMSPKQLSNRNYVKNVSHFTKSKIKSFFWSASMVKFPISWDSVKWTLYGGFLTFETHHANRYSLSYKTYLPTRALHKDNKNIYELNFLFTINLTIITKKKIRLLILDFIPYAFRDWYKKNL